MLFHGTFLRRLSFSLLVANKYVGLQFSIMCTLYPYSPDPISHIDKTIDTACDRSHYSRLVLFVCFIVIVPQIRSFAHILLALRRGRASALEHVHIVGFSLAPN